MTTISRATKEDIEGIQLVLGESVRGLCKDYYTTNQVEVWSHRPIDQKKWQDHIKNNYVWVVKNDINELIGYCLAMDKKEGFYIASLYFLPSSAGKGLGKKLMKEVEFYAFKKNKVMILNSTLNAVKFYQSCGFEICGGVALYPLDNINLECLPMKKMRGCLNA